VKFEAYLAGDFVGADMARKFLQMGYSRSRRDANYKGGRKYDPPQRAQAIRSNPKRPRFSIRPGRPPKEIRKKAWKKKAGWVRF